MNSNNISQENSQETVIEQSEQIEQAMATKRTADTDEAPEAITSEPENEFLNFALSEEIQKALVKLKFTKATPVQKACIPFLLENETDIVALAKTGTGKTAAFGLPVAEKITAGEGLQTLVLCPTRELAQQVAINLKSFGEFKKLKVATVVGGESYDKQIRAIKNNPEILVSTPGRLVDLMDQDIVDLSEVKYLVLDEADEMLSFGFEEALETIWKATAKQDLKTWLFSATMSKQIRNLANKYLKDAHEVTLNTHSEKTLVDSYACVIFEEDKEDALSLLIKNTQDFYGIIFATTKKQVADLEIKLRNLGLDVDSLHGDKVQADRTRTIERMKSKRTKILVATDVAARGLDIQDLTHVVNFEIPWDVETYTHRIGRTARAGKTGTVWTMVKPKESSKLVRFERALGNKFKNLRIPLVEEVQVNQKMTWLKEMVKRNTRESDILKFEKAIASIEDSTLKDLSAETKHWLAKAIDYFGQGEELRMKQPRSLELRERSDDGRGEGRRYEGGGRDERRGGGSGGRFGRNGGGDRSRGGGFGGQRRDRGSERDDHSTRSRNSNGYESRGESDDNRGNRFDRNVSSTEARSERRGERSWGFNKPSQGSGGESRGLRGGRGGGSGRGDSSGRGASRGGERSSRSRNSSY
ncbi:MAG: DEAD/DEAH box helicase [Pseudobdellovibrio sp.]